MWNSSPLVQDGFGLVGGPVNWLSHQEMNLSNKEDSVRQLPYKNMASLFKDEQTLSGPQPPQHVLFGNSQNGGRNNTSGAAIADGSWLPTTLFGPTTNPDNQALLKHKGETVQNGLIYRSTVGPAANHQFEMPTPNSWTRKDWMMPGSRESSTMFWSPHI